MKRTRIAYKIKGIQEGKHVVLFLWYHGAVLPQQSHTRQLFVAQCVQR
jgi:hypothetical protein